MLRNYHPVLQRRSPASIYIQFLAPREPTLALGERKITYNFIMKYKVTGFSLIELMVIVAIVALLAAAASPIFKQHVAKAKFAEAVQYMHDLGRKSMEYGMANGTLGTMQDLGFPGTTHDQTLSNGVTITSIQIVLPAANCPLRGYTWAVADPEELGLDGVTSLGFGCDMWAYNKAFHTACFFEALDGSLAVTDDDLLGANWINMNSTTTNNHDAYTAYLNSQGTYTGRSCYF